MTFVGHGWRSGGVTDPSVNTGAASTATVGSLTPNTGPRSAGLISLTVTGTGFTANTVIYAAYSPVPTTYVSATSLTTTAFNSRPDSGAAGNIPVGVVKPGEKISNTVNFAAT